ncbi:MAG: hypothetical protein JW902_01980 [Syntrophaceae bacterium]|nr:hypothetical protein [Syntrophaceae bacterium]
MKQNELRSILRAQLAIPRMGTFKRLKSKRCRKCWNLVLDEWHRLPRYVVNKCDEWCHSRSTRGWYLNGSCVKRSVYFVSATPVNPVLEDEVRSDEIIEKVYEDDEESLKVALDRTMSIIMAFSNNYRVNKKGLFQNFLNRAKVGYVSAEKIGWKYPSSLKWKNLNPNNPDSVLVEHLRDKKMGDEESNWVEEYALASGLVRTRRRQRQYFLFPGPKSKGGRSFGINYKRLYVHKSSSGQAVNWLRQHPRVRYALEALISAGMIIKTKNDSYRWFGTSKAILFCTHQSVALGLTATLKKIILDGHLVGSRMVSIGTNVQNRDLEALIERFSDHNSGMRILVATDALSESIDLHESCKTVIHYELPWSPLRLLQRVGRLTRLKESISGKVSFNRGVHVAHIVIPFSVEEERANRLVRRIKFLHEQGLWPGKKSHKEVIRGLLGSGPSQHLAWYLNSHERV